MASGIYNCFKIDLWNGDVDADSDTIHIGLYNDSHAFEATAVTYTTANELSTGSGYTRDGKTLTISLATATAGTVGWDATDVSWTGATFSAYHAVIYDEDNSDSLICSIDFGGEQAVASGTFTIQWSTAGIISMT